MGGFRGGGRSRDALGCRSMVGVMRGFEVPLMSGGRADPTQRFPTGYSLTNPFTVPHLLTIPPFLSLCCQNYKLQRAVSR